MADCRNGAGRPGLSVFFRAWPAGQGYQRRRRGWDGRAAISTYDLKAGDEDWTQCHPRRRTGGRVGETEGQGGDAGDRCLPFRDDFPLLVARGRISPCRAPAICRARLRKPPNSRRHGACASTSRRYRQARAIDGRWADRLECCGCLSGGVGRCSPAGRRSAWCFHIRLHSRLQT